MDPAAFVLKDFSTTELKELPFALDRCVDVAEALAPVAESTLADLCGIRATGRRPRRIAAHS